MQPTQSKPRRSRFPDVIVQSFWLSYSPHHRAIGPTVLADPSPWRYNRRTFKFSLALWRWEWRVVIAPRRRKRNPAGGEP